MTRFPHDQFAKDYLEELLAPLGEVQAPRRVAGEVRQIDVWFAPARPTVANAQTLGLLGRFAATPSLFEPFRNPATPTDICNCLLKLLELRGECDREANRNQQRLEEDNLPRLWILTPTASASVLHGFGAIVDEVNWLPGIHFLASYLRTAIVAIHQLPRNQETLWLRILGREKVQEQAIEELAALPQNHPLRGNVIKLVTNLNANLQADNENLDEEDRELVMKFSPLYEQWREEALQEGEQLGIQREKRVIIENLIKVRFGALDEQLSAIVEPLWLLPSEEFTRLLLQLSREELLARFGGSRL